jgi:hypothetical protein
MKGRILEKLSTRRNVGVVSADGDRQERKTLAREGEGKELWQLTFKNRLISPLKLVMIAPSAGRKLAQCA